MRAFLLPVYEAKARGAVVAAVNQLVRTQTTRARKVAKSNVPALEACPQKRGVCTRVYTTTLKTGTPHCVKFAVFVLTNGFEVTSYIGGESQPAGSTP
ncbi:30S ribosomal protein S12 [Salmonella enterica subsp. enterica]|nr:30S ribosomal protein S12 [Salmonella enterica subsp. enterica]